MKNNYFSFKEDGEYPKEKTFDGKDLFPQGGVPGLLLKELARIAREILSYYYINAVSKSLFAEKFYKV